MDWMDGWMEEMIDLMEIGFSLYSLLIYDSFRKI